MSSPGVQSFSTSYEVSPIILTGGIAPQGEGLPIISITNSQDYNGLLDSADADFNPTTDAFATYVVQPGGTLIENDFGEYPFANQQIAANAVIRQPLRIVVRMICPAKTKGDYLAKNAILTQLQNTLAKHNNSGGLYTVATPAFYYTDCLLRQLIDSSAGETKQVQYQYDFIFEQPLLTLQEAQQAYSQLLNQLSSGAQVTNPNWSGDPNPGSTTSLTTPGNIPAATSLGGAGVANPPANFPTQGITTTLPFNIGAP